MQSLIPLPLPQVLKAVMALGAYTAALPFREPLAEIGLSPLALAVIAGLLSFFFRNMSQVLERSQTAESPQTIASIWLVLALAGSAVIVFAPSDQIIQHGVSLALTLNAAAFTALAIWDPQSLSKIRWVGQNWGQGQRTAAAWHVGRLLGTVSALELLVMWGTELDWVLGFAVIPVLAYYTMWLGIYVTFPREDH